MQRVISLVIFILLSAGPLAHAQSCDSSEMDASWSAMIEAYQAQDLDLTIIAIDHIIDLCGDDPRTTVPRMMRADIAMNQNKPEDVLKWLNTVAYEPGGALTKHMYWLYMMANY